MAASALCGEFPENGFERDPAGAVLRATPFEIDPTLVETIDHADAGQRMLHSLRVEQRLPRVARHWFRPHRVAERFRKTRGDVVSRIAARPFEFNDA